MIVTERAGLFAKHGLDVTTRLMGGAKGVVKGLMEGEIQFGNLAAPALLRAGLKEGADLVFLTGGINQQFLVARSAIKDRSELGGARIGFVGDGGLNDVLVHFIAEELSTKGIGGIRILPLRGAGRQSMGALLAGDCDALVMTPPEAIEARMRGCVFLVDFAEFGLNYALGGIAVRHRTIQDDPEMVRRFVKAYVEGMRRYRMDREFTIRVQQEYSGIADRTVAEETYDLTRPGMPEIPYPVPHALQTALKVMAKDLPAAAKADPQRFIDDRFIRELANSAPA
jgi:ABC-type nitrate/sulfonate/bicarbonate transport system substrate-binding protein